MGEAGLSVLETGGWRGADCGENRERSLRKEKHPNKLGSTSDLKGSCHGDLWFVLDWFVQAAGGGGPGLLVGEACFDFCLLFPMGLGMKRRKVRPEWTVSFDLNHIYRLPASLLAPLSSGSTRSCSCP